MKYHDFRKYLIGKLYNNKSTVLKQRDGKSFIIALAFGLVLLGGGVVNGGQRSAEKDMSCKTLRAMARVYMAYGDYVKARPLAEQALALAKTDNVSDSERCLCLIDLAWLYKGQGKLSDAERMCGLGLELQEKLYGKDYPYVAYTLRILSSIYEGQGKYRQARPVLDRAMTIMNSYHLPDDQVMAPFYVDIAKLLTAQGHFAEAEAYYGQALTLINNSYGAKHLYTAAVLGGIARLCTLQEKYAKAEELINQALATQEKVYGPDHHLLVPTWLTMAKIYQEKKDYIQAEKLLQKALAVVKEKQHPATGRVLNILGELYILQDRYAEAGGVCREAVKVLEDSLGAGNDHTAMAFNNLAQVYVHEGKYSEAQELCHKALNTLEDIFDHNHPNVVKVLETMARLQRKTGEAAEFAKAQQNVEKIRVHKQIAYEPAATVIK